MRPEAEAVTVVIFGHDTGGLLAAAAAVRSPRSGLPVSVLAVVVAGVLGCGAGEDDRSAHTVVHAPQLARPQLAVGPPAISS
jgi:pimeloyl-ACP methyl ester carboxylesterase